MILASWWAPLSLLGLESFFFLPLEAPKAQEVSREHTFCLSLSLSLFYFSCAAPPSCERGNAK